MLRTNYEEPARDGAELRRQVLTSPEGSLLLRHERAHALTFHRAYDGVPEGAASESQDGPAAGCAGAGRW